MAELATITTEQQVGNSSTMFISVDTSRHDGTYSRRGLRYVWFTVLWLVAGSLVPRADQAAQLREEDAGHFFGLTNLWTIHLTLSREDWSAMEPEGPRRPGVFQTDYPWRTCTFECSGQALTDVAVRFKGNSSFNSARGGFKRPFKLDFNRDHPERAFLGLKKLSMTFPTLGLAAASEPLAGFPTGARRHESNRSFGTEQFRGSVRAKSATTSFRKLANE